MTFNRLAEDARARLEDNIILFDSSFDDVVETVEADPETPSNWREVELSPADVAGLLAWVHSKLQLLCMSWSSGTEVHDRELYGEANRVLEAWKAAVEANFGVQLETRPVRSMVDEMVDARFLTRFEGPDGEALVGLTEEGQQIAESIRRASKAQNN